MTTLVDTNVLIYALNSEATHHEWATESIAQRRTAGHW